MSVQNEKSYLPTIAVRQNEFTQGKQNLKSRQGMERNIIHFKL